MKEPWISLLGFSQEEVESGGFNPTTPKSNFTNTENEFDHMCSAEWLLIFDSSGLC